MPSKTDDHVEITVTVRVPNALVKEMQRAAFEQSLEAQARLTATFGQVVFDGIAQAQQSWMRAFLPAPGSGSGRG